MVINGLLVVNKPQGLFSLDVVKELKRRFNLRKAGHIGTLDPFATGVLPIVINEGTKLVPFINEEPKEYEGTMKLGEETTTGDTTGDVVSRMTLETITKEIIYKVINCFIGKIKQIPPMFSAVKVNGKPLYKFARKGIDINRPEREVEIFCFKVLHIDLPLVRFYISCSKGTYIRSLASDIGKRLGCGAHLIELRRIRSGVFDLSKAISWERLTSILRPKDLYPYIISLNESLPHLFEVIGDDDLIQKVKKGKWLMRNDVSKLDLSEIKVGSFIKLCTKERELVAILKSEIRGIDRSEEKLILRPLRIFNSPSNPYFHFEISTMNNWNKRVSLS